MTERRLTQVLYVHDPLTARCAQDLGFDAVHIGGGLTARYGHGLADGEITPSEVIAEARRIQAVVDLPVSIDLDDAGGAPPLVTRYVRMAEQAGAEAVMIEDIDCANRWRWNPAEKEWDYTPQRMRDIDAAADLIGVAAAARRDSGTVIIARTEALSDSYSEALRRAEAYAANGADAIFIMGLSVDSITTTQDRIKIPLAQFISAPVPRRTRVLLHESGLSMAFYSPPSPQLAELTDNLARYFDTDGS